MAKSKPHSQKTELAESDPAKRFPFVKHPILPILLLVLVSALVYANSLQNGFVFDDIGTIVENKYITDFSKNLPSFFNSSYFKIAHTEGSYRPVATFTYYLLYAAFSLNPFGYHLASLILHILNVILVYFLLNRLQPTRLTSLLAALMFACHPVISEAVNCISYNEDLLTAFFYLLALLCYIKATEQDKKPDKGYYIFSLVFFLAGLLSKEMAITLPAMVVLYDAVFRETVDRQTFAKQIKNVVEQRSFFYSGYIAVSLFYLSLRFLIFVNPKHSIVRSYGSLIERIIYLPDHIFNYIKMAVFPLNLNADHVFAYPQTFFEATNIISLVIIAGLLVLSFFVYKKSKELSFGMWWLFVTLFPVYNLIEIANPIADRYLYLPLVGFCLAISIILNDLLDHLGRPNVNKTGVLKAFIFLLIFGFYASITVARNRVWKDDFSLWTKTLESSSNSAIVHGNLGRAYQNQGLLKEAIAAYRSAIQINPADYKAYYNLGTIYEEQGSLKNAIRSYMKATEINPEFLNSHFNLANIYAQMGRLDEAVPHLKKSVAINPGDFEAHNNLGVIYARQGKLDQAISEWEAVLKIDPKNKEAQGNILKAKKMLNK